MSVISKTISLSPISLRLLYLKYKRNQIIEESIIKSVKKIKNPLRKLRILSNLTIKTFNTKYIEDIINMDVDVFYKVYALGKLINSPLEGYVIETIEKNAYKLIDKEKTTTATFSKIDMNDKKVIFGSITCFFSSIYLLSRTSPQLLAKLSPLFILSGTLLGYKLISNIIKIKDIEKNFNRSARIINKIYSEAMVRK